MRLAIFSDVHGNIFALEAVLNAIAHDGPFDALIAAGDLALGGSDPAGCVDLLRQTSVLAVYGNTETYLLQPDNPPPDELHFKKWDHLRPQVDWALALLGDDRVAWLRALPLDLRFPPGGGGVLSTLFNKSENDQEASAQDLLVFHGNPKDIIDFIFPPPDQQPNFFGKILQPDDSPELVRLMDGVIPLTCAFGHMHITSTRLWRDYTLVNVASCSLPSLEKDPRARYTIFEWDGTAWQITRRYVDYDYKREVKALKACGIPFAEDFWQAYS